MAVFSGEVTIRVKFNKIQIPVGFGMTSAIIKHRCVEQAYAISPWSQIKDARDKRFEVVVENIKHWKTAYSRSKHVKKMLK